MHIAMRQLLAAAALLAISSSSQGAPFKCYVITEDGSDRLYLVDTIDLNEAQMAATTARMKVGGKKKLKVSKVMECQPEAKPFLDPTASALDRRTPR
jgi:hypothetical protein